MTNIARINVSFDTTNLTPGRMTHIIPVAPDIETLIGKIAIQWGNLEDTINNLVRGLIDFGIAIPEGTRPTWEGPPFDKRKNLLEELTKDFLAQADRDDLWRRFQAISGTISRLHHLRNVVLKGFYRVKAMGHDEDLKMTAVNNRKGIKTEIDLTVDRLAQIWHDIAHVSADFIILSKDMNVNFSQDLLLLNDTVFLQEDRLEILQIQPNGQPHPEPPRAIPDRRRPP